MNKVQKAGNALQPFVDACKGIDETAKRLSRNVPEINISDSLDDEMRKIKSAKLILELINTSIQGEMIKSVYRSALDDLYEFNDKSVICTGDTSTAYFLEE